MWSEPTRNDFLICGDGDNTASIGNTCGLSDSILGHVGQQLTSKDIATDDSVHIVGG
jgi:hypothetical protein